MGLLLLRLLPREPYDMLALIEQKRRRAQFQRLARQGFEPWEHSPARGAGDTTRGGESAPSPQDEALMQRRAQISEAVSRHDLPDAAERYAQLLGDDPKQVMSESAQLDLATQLAAEGRYDIAAQAYELFLGAYRDYHQRPQVQLILGLIYANYLDQSGRARELLTAAREGVTGDEQALADATLKRLG